jgi:hypothetical protein
MAPLRLGFLFALALTEVPQLSLTDSLRMSCKDAQSHTI